jgi:hypothetical protein
MGIQSIGVGAAEDGNPEIAALLAYRRGLARMAGSADAPATAASLMSEPCRIRAE